MDFSTFRSVSDHRVASSFILVCPLCLISHKDIPELTGTQSSAVIAISIANDLWHGRRTSENRTWTAIGILLVLVCEWSSHVGSMAEPNRILCSGDLYSYLVHIVRARN